ncbi:MAG: hypothetical protein AAF708_10025 [Deinococcota bacterium]
MRMTLVPLMLFRFMLVVITLYGFYDTFKYIWTMKQRIYDPLSPGSKRLVWKIMRGNKATRAKARGLLEQLLGMGLRRYWTLLIPNILLLVLLLSINVLSFTMFRSADTLVATP